MKKTVCIKTLGCKVNSYESEFIRSLFLKDGYEVVEENASVYVVNTCTVTNNSDNKSKKLINSIRRNNKNSILIVVGCFCENYKDKIRELIDADIILGNHEKSKIIEYLKEYIDNKNKITSFNKSFCFENMEIDKFDTHTRAFVKIQDGCNNYCSYCIIPYVRGNVKSKRLTTILDEIKKLISNSHKEIVLTGIHTGQYGIDRGYTFSFLLKEILKIKGLERLRISSIEVVEITDEVLEILKNNNILVSHFHIPLQSGSNKILKLMNRRYDKEYFIDKINTIRSIRPEISITTDVIVGFPGETEEDFEETYDLCKKIGFSKIHVFPYSDRSGTKAFDMINKVPGNIKKQRVNKLIELSNTLEKEYYNKFIGKSVDVLIEEYKDNYYYGHTSNYLYLKLKGNYETNKIYKVILKEENII